MNKLQNKIKYKSLPTIKSSLNNRTLKLDSVFCETPCSNERNVEEKRVFEALRNYNGYPRKFLRKVCNKVKSNSIQDITKASTESESSKDLVILPYIKGTTEQLKRVLLKHKFKVTTKPMFTLRSQLMRPKDALGIWNKVVLSTIFHAKIAMLNISVKLDEFLGHGKINTSEPFDWKRVKTQRWENMFMMRITR